MVRVLTGKQRNMGCEGGGHYGHIVGEYDRLHSNGVEIRRAHSTVPHEAEVIGPCGVHGDEEYEPWPGNGVGLLGASPHDQG